MTATFRDLDINEDLTAGLKMAGIEEPTAVQLQAIAPILAGRDVICQSPTGTGKTLAFLLPLFQRLDPAKKEVQAVVLAPTHELAVQITRESEKLAGNSGIPLKAAAMIGNVNIARQIDKLKERPQLIVGSAGRILELIQKRKINAQTIKSIVLDEADRLLDESNLPAVQAVIKTTQRDRQLLLFSATITPAALSVGQTLTQDPLLLAVKAETQQLAAIEHAYFVVDHRDKAETLRKIICHLDARRALVFINQSHATETVTAKLRFHGLAAVGLHGSSYKKERKEAMDAFRSGRATVLVASDIAARGLDIEDIDYVFNLDMPEDPEVYLHRAGRTGRAGKTGAAVSLVTKAEEGVIKKYERRFNLKIGVKCLEHGRIKGKHHK